jgi:TonB family protein
MKDNRIYSSFYCSLGFHSFVLIAIVAYILITGPARKMTSLTVSLVESPVRGSVAATNTATPQVKEKEVEPAEEEAAPTVTKAIPEPRTHTAKDRIAALQAKKQVERNATLRKQVNVSKGGARAAGGGDPGGGTYDSVIATIITKNWANADFLNKFRSLRAIITIRIARNGEITILGWEKKSGSSLFDREALRALTISSPLPPPPSGEMERSINFDPQQKGR